MRETPDELVARYEERQRWKATKAEREMAQELDTIIAEHGVEPRCPDLPGHETHSPPCGAMQEWAELLAGGAERRHAPRP